MHFLRRRAASPRPFLLVMAALAAVLAVALVPRTARADMPDTVATANPSNVTINLFDYWLDDNNKIATVNNQRNQRDDWGINQGHQLKFNIGYGRGINGYTGRGGGPLQGFVSRTLSGGYPTLVPGSYTTPNGTSQVTSAESLAYLFDPAVSIGFKETHADVTGLFQLQDGYYTYDCQHNYAAYDEESNSFLVYDQPAVHKGSPTGVVGQFFPFNPASFVFDSTTGTANSVFDGQNQPGAAGTGPGGTRVQHDDTMLNHHFGFTMQTEFTMTQNGLAPNGRDPLTFQFSGDDDVWIYIDGMLVGDLGGIHGAETITINFQTGEVLVRQPNSDDTANPNGTVFQRTTIREQMEAARPDLTDADFDGNTLKQGSQHQLNFFYLERGAGASNMSLRFNLVAQPTSVVDKVDQNGAAVAGASFSMYRTGDDYVYTDADKIAEGTTDSVGRLSLNYTISDEDAGITSGEPVSLTLEHSMGNDHFVLKEDEVPAGYHSSLAQALPEAAGELHLLYKASENPRLNTGGALVSPLQTVTVDGQSLTVSRQWLNGGYVGATETITAPATASSVDGQPLDLTTGVTFAVPTRRESASSPWVPIKGSALAGYTLTSSPGVAGALEAVHAQGGGCVFSPNTTGQLEARLEELPGYIDQYECMLPDGSNPLYTVSIFHSSASSLANATEANTVQVADEVDNAGFVRTFSAVLHITNVQNRLYVNKADENGTPVDGATFELYSSDDVTVGADGTYTIKDGATPLDSATTAHQTFPFDADGSACFPIDSTNHVPLSKGIYYVRESAAPEGYEVNPTVARVIVNDDGVFADGGAEGDGVYSGGGTGSLLATLRQFGVPGSLDATLNRVTARLRVGTYDASDGSISWADPATPTTFELHYPEEQVVARGVIEYQTQDGSLPVATTDTGIARLSITQDLTWLDDNDLGANGSPDTDNLGNLPLNQLFSMSAGVLYVDHHVTVDWQPYLTKTLTGRAATNGQFGFTLTPSDAASAELLGLQAGETRTLSSAAAADGQASAPVSLTGGTPVRLTSENAGHTYTYTLAETTGGGAGYTNDTATRTITLAVSVDGSVLTATTTVETEGGEAKTYTQRSSDTGDTAVTIPFANSYVATGSVSVNARKVLTGRAQTAGEFSFELRDDATNEVVARGTNAADGTIDLGELSFTQADVGTHAYTLVENTSSLPQGVRAESSRTGLTVSVEDNGDGTLTVTPHYPNGSQTGPLKLLNAYGTDAEAAVSMAGKKTLTTPEGQGYHAPSIEGAYRFTLTGENGAPMPAGSDGQQKVVTNNGGVVDFGTITYGIADAGSVYTYTVSEAAGDGAPAGVSVDGATKTVVVRVTDNGDGTITAGAEDAAGMPLEGELFSFTNAYRPAPVTASVTDTISVTKTLAGRALRAGEFSFELADARTGERLQEATNSVDDEGLGHVTFAPITYDQPGEHDYLVREVAPQQAEQGVAFDLHAQTVHVSVTDDGSGQLVATVTLTNPPAGAKDNTIAFENTYTPPKEPEKPTDPEEPTKPEQPTQPTKPAGPSEAATTPNTGDDTQVLLPALLVGAGAAIVIGALWLRRRGRSRS